jgi:hypothetical protein
MENELSGTFMRDSAMWSGQFCQLRLKIFGPLPQNKNRDYLITAFLNNQILSRWNAFTGL